MPNIINISHFQSKNSLWLPGSKNTIQSVAGYGGTTNEAFISSKISEIEKDLLIKSLGIILYNELQTALVDLPGSDVKYQNLVNGETYTYENETYIWEGLSNEYSLIAHAVYCSVIDEREDFLTTDGTFQNNAENAKKVSYRYKYVASWQKFHKKYQGSANCFPDIYYHNSAMVIDYLNGDSFSPESSLYQYLFHKKDVFGWEERFFKFYENQNSIGI